MLTSSSTFAQWGLNGSPIGPTNWLGSTNNQPLKINTNSINRAHINPNRVETIGGYTINANGFMGLGENSVAPAHPNGVRNDFGPFSLLHLNGETASGDFAQEWGYRSWMRTGISFTTFNDFS